MFIDKINFGFLDNLFEKSGSSSSTPIAPATIKRDYSFVGNFDDDEDNETNLEFDEKEFETSAQKAGTSDTTDATKKDSTADDTKTNTDDETKAGATDETKTDNTDEKKTGNTDEDKTGTNEETKNEPYTENDGTFFFKGKKLYRNGQKYTGEFEGRLYKKGKLLKGETNGFRYKDGVKLTGKRHGKWYIDGVLAEGEINGVIYHNGKLLTGTAKYTPNKEDGTADTENAVERFYKKGVPSAGKFNGIRYGADGLPLNGTYKKHTYVNGVKQK